MPAKTLSSSHLPWNRRSERPEMAKSLEVGDVKIPRLLPSGSLGRPLSLNPNDLVGCCVIFLASMYKNGGKWEVLGSIPPDLFMYWVVK